MTDKKSSSTPVKKKEENLLKAHKAVAEKKAHASEKHEAAAPAKKPEVKKALEHNPEAKKTTEHKTEAPKTEAEPKAAEVKEKTESPKGKTKKVETPVVKKEKKVKKEKLIEKITLTAELKTIEGKKKKPAFIRQEYYKLPRLKLVWRKPRGIDSKQHEGKKGKGAKPDVGYGTPEGVRGMHGAGYFPIVVNNVKEVEKINTKTQAAVIASAVGRKKRNEIIAAANKLKVIILNPRKGETQ